MMSGFATIEEALEEIRQGRVRSFVDDEDRENEGDLVMAPTRSRRGRQLHGDARARAHVRAHARRAPGRAEARHDGGREHGPMGTAFTISVDARRGITPASPPTIAPSPSAPWSIRRCPPATSSRRATCSAAGDGRGVLRRAGHTSAVDLARMAGAIRPA